MLRTGERVLLGSDAAGKYYAEIAAAPEAGTQERRIMIICERTDKKTESVGVPISVLESLRDRIHQQDVRRSHEEE